MQSFCLWEFNYTFAACFQKQTFRVATKTLFQIYLIKFP